MPKRKSNFNRAVVFVLLILALVLMACESFPKPRSDTDILFVVPVVYLDSQRAPSRNISFGYKIVLENTQTGERKHVTIDSSNPYKFIKNWSEGEYLIKEYSSIGFADNWTSKLEINQYLKLEKGKLAIFPCKIVIVLLESTSPFYDTSIYVKFIPLYEDDYRRILEFLSTYENYHFWKS